MLNNGRIQAKILDIPFSGKSKEGVLREIQDLVAKKTGFYITTPNPEHLVLASKDDQFKQILINSDISLADGIGILAAKRFLTLKRVHGKLVKLPVYLLQGLFTGAEVIVKRKNLKSGAIALIHGSVLFEDLISLSNKRRWRVVLLGGKTTPIAAKVLLRNYKKIDILGLCAPNYDSYSQPLTQDDSDLHNKIISRVNSFKPHLLFIGLGAPKQEFWISKYKNSVNSLGLMVVGGTFDYISGFAKAPPPFYRKTESEWLWRLISQPWRLKRIMTAVVIFPLMVFRQKLEEKVESV
jgi:N-acetylglucosaminyldiphosphoundecaprenol N-acetyl-beta-D-mannosaminyltransferase